MLALQGKALYQRLDNGGGLTADGSCGGGGGGDRPVLDGAEARYNRQYAVVEMLYAAILEDGGVTASHRTNIQKYIGPFDNEGTSAALLPFNNQGASTLGVAYAPVPTQADKQENRVRTDTGPTIWHRFVTQCIDDRDATGIPNRPAEVANELRRILLG